MGWTPEVALAMDVAMIELALESRSDLLATIFGSGKKDKDKPKGKKGTVSPARFKAFRDRINGTKPQKS